jgi:hypothetical protein
MAGEFREAQKVSIRCVDNGTVGNGEGSNLGIRDEAAAC